MVFSCFDVYVLANNTRVGLNQYISIVVYGKYGTTRVLFVSTYTAKQLQTMLSKHCAQISSIVRQINDLISSLYQTFFQPMKV